MIYREGVSQKTGKQWKGYFCPTPKGAPDQCAPQFLKDQQGRQAATQNFNNQLNSTEYKEAQTIKDKTITRSAICKSLIERGEKWSPAVQAEAEAWLAWVENRAPKAMPTDEIQIEDIPSF